MFAALFAPSAPPAALLSIARNFSPRVERVGSLVVLDASGLSRLFGSAQELGEHLLTEVQHAGSAQGFSTGVQHGGSRCAVVVAPTATAAMLLALSRRGLVVVEPGQAAAALAPLSVSVLAAFERLCEGTGSREPGTERHSSTPDSRPPTPEGGWGHPRHTHQASHAKASRPHTLKPSGLLNVLMKWGIRTLGALSALAGPEVYERLGAPGLAWQRLARGDDPRPMVPWVEAEPFEAVLELEWPIDGLEPLSFVLARLLEPLAVRLERADRGAAVIYTSLRLTTKAVQTRSLQLPAPMRDPKTLRTLILLDLESHPPAAAIDTVRVLIDPTPGRVVQWTLLDRAQPAPEQVSTLTARLTALMGEGHVGAPALVDSWKPGAFVMHAFEVQSSKFKVQKAIEAHPQLVNSALRRFRLPIPARVQVREGRPVRVTLDRHGYTSGAVAQAAGPWRTSGEWWAAEAPPGDRSAPSAALEPSAFNLRSSAAPEPSAFHLRSSAAPSAAWDRDEWDIAMTDGTIYRLCVEREVGQWFVEGIID